METGRNSYNANTVITKILILFLGIFLVILAGIIATFWLDGNERIAARQSQIIEDKKSDLMIASQLVFDTIEKIHQQNANQGQQKILSTRVQDIITLLKDRRDDLQKAGRTEEQIKEELLNIVRYTRFNKGRGYLWINDRLPRMVMHPIQPQLNGRDLTEYKDPKGKYLFREFVTVVKEKGSGFVEYYWPKPGETEAVPKVSFVQEFTPYQWIIGTGEYLETIEAETKEKMKTAVASFRYSMGEVKNNYFWINDLHPTMVMHPEKPELDGKDLTENKDPKGKFLFREFVKVAQAKGEGFVDYLWPKPGEEEPAQKISYVRLFKPYGWVVGTGVYLDSIGIEASLAIEAQSIRNSIRNFIAVVAGVFLVGGLIFFLALRKYTNPLKGMMNLLTEINASSNQFAAASYQLSGVSDSLSRGSSDQAASLEQISGTLTEIEAKTRENATMSTEANRVSMSASQDAEKGNQEMRDLVDALNAIDGSSKDISKIIKTIDEIAFQTNLLALNAAVEAARAGDAGRGFAVVAEEVRNLASRSAKAARETSDLIDSSVKSIKTSSEMANQTAESLQRIVEGVNNVTLMMGQLEGSAVEQVEGISQVNQALEQIDIVTQQNAATSEETSSTSAQIASMASGMRQMLAQFQLGADHNGDLNDESAGNGDGVSARTIHQLPTAPTPAGFQSEPPTMEPAMDSLRLKSKNDLDH